MGRSGGTETDLEKLLSLLSGKSKASVMRLPHTFMFGMRLRRFDR